METDHVSRAVRAFAIYAFGFMTFADLQAQSTDQSSASPPPVAMEAFKVDSNYMPKLSFGISINVWKDNNTQKVISIVINQVKPGSEAERKGLTALARIDRIDGRPVQDYAASFLKGTELNHLFVNRHNGDKITIEFTLPGQPESQTVTLTEHRNTQPMAWERLGN